jgi:DNA-binding NarL/FixJ family response regulator
VLVVEDFERYRTFVCSLLEDRADLKVIGAVSDGLTAVEKARQLNPDLIIMDIGLPRLNGIEATRRIREFVPTPKIIFLTQETSAEIIEDALELGSGYVLKSRVQVDLLIAMAAAEGTKFVSPGLRRDQIAAQISEVAD